MKIAVLVSGGVDSTVALHLLSRYHPAAFFLKIQPGCGDLPPGGKSSGVVRTLSTAPGPSSRTIEGSGRISVHRPQARCGGSSS